MAIIATGFRCAGEFLGVTKLLDPVKGWMDRKLGNKNWTDIVEHFGDRGFGDAEAVGRGIASGTRVLRDDVSHGVRHLVVQVERGIEVVHDDGTALVVAAHNDIHQVAGAAGAVIRTVHEDAVTGTRTIYLDLAAGARVAYSDARAGARIVHDDLVGLVQTGDEYIRTTAQAFHDKLTQGVEFGYTATAGVVTYVASARLLNSNCEYSGLSPQNIAGHSFQMISVLAALNMLRIGCGVKIKNTVHHVLGNETLKNIVLEVGEAGLTALGLYSIGNEVYGAVTDPNYSAEERSMRLLLPAGVTLLTLALIKLTKNKRATVPQPVVQRPAVNNRPAVVREIAAAPAPAPAVLANQHAQPPVGVDAVQDEYTKNKQDIERLLAARAAKRNGQIN